MHGKDSSRLDYEQYLLVGEVRRASKYNRKKIQNDVSAELWEWGLRNVASRSALKSLYSFTFFFRLARRSSPKQRTASSLQVIESSEQPTSDKIMSVFSVCISISAVYSWW